MLNDPVVIAGASGQPLHFERAELLRKNGLTDLPNAMAKLCWIVSSALCAWLSGAAPASAHPHVWIEARAVVVYEGGRPVAVRNAWTFDPAYSAFLTLGASRDEAGTVRPGALDESARKAVSSVAESDYFTEARGEAGRKGLGAPSGASMDVAGDRATLRFELPISDRHAPTGELSAGQLRLEVMDPSYFVAFAFAPGDAVSLEGAPAGCAIELRRPKGFSGEDAKTLAAGVLTALSGDGAADRIGNVATVSCPVPAP
jgi:ABC-type uncharacterized transport system substrate-binding protein